MGIEPWVNRLEERYQRLAGARSGLPVFALEHGLNEKERQLFFVEMAGLIPARGLQPEHALAWVAYAAEFGYAYSGESFWPEFEKRTNGWRSTQRDWLKRCYVWFAEEFHGARPQSAWATNFNIIAWPIVHGVIPRDLQRLLVELLFVARPPASAFESPRALGQYLHGAAAERSSRFQELAENEELLGQVAAALLLPASNDALIAADTLSRIISDISAERSGKAWLDDARQRLERLQIDGLRKHEARSGVSTQNMALDGDSVTYAVQARFELREEEEGRWGMWVRVPSFAPLTTLWPQTRAVLTQARPRFVLGNGRLLARGMLLHGLWQRVETWPAGGVPILELETPSVEISRLLGSLVTPTGKVTLFKITEPGVALHVASGAVAPDRDYLLVARHGFLPPPELGKKTEVRGAGYAAYRFHTPHRFDQQWTTVAAAAGLKVHRRLRVRPVGELPAVWDDEGYAEVLDGQPLTLAITTDGVAGTLRVSLDGAESLIHTLPEGAEGSPVYVHMQPLARGEHSLVMRFTDSTGVDTAGDARVVVRAPGATGRTRGTCGAVVVYASPEDFSLEQLWEARCELTITGMPEQSVRVGLDLLGDGLCQLGTLAWTIAPPLSPEQWGRSWSAAIAQHPEAGEWYQGAKLGRLRFDVGEYGYRAFECRRTTSALRWHLEGTDSLPTLRLIDDDSEVCSATIDWYPLETPLNPQRLEPVGEPETLAVPGRGGLFVARRGSRIASAVCVTPSGRTDIALGRVPLRLPQLPADVDHLVTAAATLGMWDAASMKSWMIAGGEKAFAIAAISRAWFAALGGEPWAKAELGFLAGRMTAEQLAKHVVPANTTHAVVGELLGYQASAQRLTAGERMVGLMATLREVLPEEAAGMSSRDVVALRPGKRRRVDHTKDIVEGAFLLSSEPANLLRMSERDLRALMERLLIAPSMTRAVRWVVLCCIGQGQPARQWAWA